MIVPKAAFFEKPLGGDKRLVANGWNWHIFLHGSVSPLGSRTTRFLDQFTSEAVEVFK